MHPPKKFLVRLQRTIFTAPHIFIAESVHTTSQFFSAIHQREGPRTPENIASSLGRV
jgi:hypothetical protein